MGDFFKHLPDNIEEVNLAACTYEPVLYYNIL